MDPDADVYDEYDELRYGAEGYSDEDDEDEDDEDEDEDDDEEEEEEDERVCVECHEFQTDMDLMCRGPLDKFRRCALCTIRCAECERAFWSDVDLDRGSNEKKFSTRATPATARFRTAFHNSDRVSRAKHCRALLRATLGQQRAL